MTNNSNLVIAFASFAAAFLICILIVRTKPFHGHLSSDHMDGVQKFHSAPTPRIGGVALILGYLLSWSLHEGETREILGLIGIASLPVIVAGLAEDISKSVTIRMRLVSTFVAGILFCLLSGYTIEHVYVWWFDILLSNPLFSIAFTAFAIASAANAINIIDGFHGLASGTVLIMLAATGMVSWFVDDTVLLGVSLSLAAVTAGFFLVNFPFGKIFLGDGGAYFLGFAIATITVMLPARTPELTPWVCPLILSYPLTEMVVSIARKLRRKGHHPGKPDNLHLHMLVHRIVVGQSGSRARSEAFKHALTSMLLWIFPTVSLILVAASNFNDQFTIRSTIIVFVAYLIVYNKALNYNKKSKE